MKPETVKLIDAVLRKAVESDWVTLEEVLTAMRDVRGEKSKRTKKVKSPELGT